MDFSVWSLYVCFQFFGFVVDKQRTKFCVNCFFPFIVHILKFCSFVLSFSLSHCSFYLFTHTAFLAYISSMFLRFQVFGSWEDSPQGTIVPKIYIVEPSLNSVFVRNVIFTKIGVAYFYLSLYMCLEILHANATHINWKISEESQRLSSVTFKGISN